MGSHLADFQGPGEGESAGRWGRQHTQAGCGCFSKPLQLGLQGRGEPSMFIASLLWPSLWFRNQNRSVLRKGKALGREGYRRGASNLDPVCRVQVLLDVPVKQTKTKLGAAGASHPKLKAYKDCVLVLHFGLDKKAWGTLFLPAGEGDQCSGHAIIWRGGPTIWLHFSFCQLSQDEPLLYKVY